ncbi:MAG: O-antigen ligase family protein [Alteromonadaceae bacterium]|nr:O-antigen ligase family protein [Alteromonadaceae bacterium]
MIKLIATAYFILVITDTYRVIPSYTPLNNMLIAATLFSLSIFFICLRYNKRTEPVEKKGLRIFLITFFFIPLTINVLSVYLFGSSISGALYWTIKSLLFLSFSYFVFLYKDIIITKKSAYLIFTIITISFIHNQIDPVFYSKIGQNYGVTLSYAKYGNIGSRYFGMYLHPNSAALTIIMITFSLRFMNVLNSLILTTAMFLIVLTGSRTALVIILLFLAFDFYYSMLTNKRIVFSNVQEIHRAFSKIAVLFGLIFAIGFILLISGDELIDRIKNIENIDNDNSAIVRDIAQQQYKTLLSANPIIGYGSEFIRQLIEKGRLIRPSHNMYLERTVQYGILGITSFLFFFLFLVRNLWHRPSLRFVIPIVLVYGIFINSFDQNMGFFLLMGVAISVLGSSKYER